ncbi:hypothetical protein MKX07_000156 [Trichoderma sp. CBMAI-0711]|uniref:Predicted protein n=5 Tax=Trichoderma TaxID=5543 RepID=G0RJF3_HYPJQ|nr:uncharacterized protein TRIREDRAFT_77887 [Trichoderma reesei QM6a]XP_024749705.1 hypothetical protein BBK36DRAFT_1119505 [Trichoderma citrinoviride]ETS01478.1 hypothetical protein M419DRAFT_111314 [Trichoderma reesei RUT C-30]KAK1242170.1 hypothetical protein MKX07_000156 [Trichoderma sp. CBMAI-0711]OTA07080.1 hypothetical protein A9Z42_0079310 [Trichoderma parareesei]PTB75825.1 hypothetical protein M440DRAFT_1402363 [Trichoderma longibrachiatum ATCC 18648]EGR48580.1 predicted protein [Tri
MVAGKKPYPKATLKKIVKAHSGMNVRKNTDITIYLNYVLFMNRLIKEAAIHAKQSGERGLTARSVRKATRDALAKFKG